MVTSELLHKIYTEFCFGYFLALLVLFYALYYRYI